MFVELFHNIKVIFVLDLQRILFASGHLVVPDLILLKNPAPGSTLFIHHIIRINVYEFAGHLDFFLVKILHAGHSHDLSRLEVFRTAELLFKELVHTH